jgi:hypothetical protein
VLLHRDTELRSPGDHLTKASPSGPWKDRRRLAAYPAEEYGGGGDAIGGGHRGDSDRGSRRRAAQPGDVAREHVAQPQPSRSRKSRVWAYVVAELEQERFELAGFGIREAGAQSLVEGRGRVPQAEE